MKSLLSKVTTLIEVYVCLSVSWGCGFNCFCLWCPFTINGTDWGSDLTWFRFGGRYRFVEERNQITYLVWDEKCDLSPDFIFTSVVCVQSPNLDNVISWPANGKEKKPSLVDLMETVIPLIWSSGAKCVENCSPIAASRSSLQTSCLWGWAMKGLIHERVVFFCSQMPIASLFIFWVLPHRFDSFHHHV